MDIPSPRASARGVPRHPGAQPGGWKLQEGPGEDDDGQGEARPGPGPADARPGATPGRGGGPGPGRPRPSKRARWRSSARGSRRRPGVTPNAPTAAPADRVREQGRVARAALRAAGPGRRAGPSLPVGSGRRSGAGSARALGLRAGLARGTNPHGLRHQGIWDRDGKRDENQRSLLIISSEMRELLQLRPGIQSM